MTRSNWHHPTVFTVADWPSRAPDTHPDTLAWIERIEDVRRGIEPTTTRTCTVCGEAKALTAFAKHTKGALGRESRCRACKSARNRLDHARRKRQQFRVILGSVAS